MCIPLGVQIAWITSPGNSFNPGAHPGTVNSSALYSVDNQNITPFLVAVQNGSNTPYTSFQTPILSPGLHRLVVEYVGVQVETGSPAPLILDYLLVQNLTIPSSSPGAVNSAGFSKGTIAGVAIGSAVGLTLIIFLLIWIIRPLIKLESSEWSEPVLRMAYLDGQAQHGEGQPGRDSL